MWPLLKSGPSPVPLDQLSLGMASSSGTLDAGQHDFEGRLHFASTTQAQGSAEDRAAFAKARLNVAVPIRDMRFRMGVVKQPKDCTSLLLDGPGFLLACAPSKVRDWNDA